MRTASLTVRIPTGRLDEFITDLEGKGSIVNRSENTEDVTLQYSDIESRKRRWKWSRTGSGLFWKKADTLDAVIALENGCLRSAMIWNPWNPSCACMIIRWNTVFCVWICQK